mgnify:CR=1 FL=1
MLSNEKMDMLVHIRNALRFLVRQQLPGEWTLQNPDSEQIDEAEKRINEAVDRIMSGHACSDA